VKNDDDRYPLKSLVAHAIHLNPDSEGAAVRSAFVDASTEFVAVVNNDQRVVGLLSLADFYRYLNSNSSTSVREAMRSTFTLVRPSDSPQAVIDRALQRADAQVSDDLILVDDLDCLIGLIPVGALLRFKQSDLQNQTNNGSSSLDTAPDTEMLSTDLRAVKAELRNARSVIEQMRGMRSEFVIKFGYEARTSMTGIMGMLNLLLDTKVNPNQRHMLSSAGASAYSLLRLIDNVLDCSSMELDNLVMEHAPFDPVKAIELAIQNTHEEADDKDLGLRFEYEGISREVMGDGKRFRQIVENLLGRSIDQTNCGGIVLRLSQKSLRGSILLHAEFIDTGMNWQVGDMDDLFTLFEKKPEAPLEDDLITLVSGRIAEKMGGRIVKRNSDKKAPRFIFELPLALPEKLSQPQEVPLAPENTATDDLKSRPLEVLIVDDDRVNLEICKAFLVRNNCNVHVALSGKEGIQILSENTIDGVLMDCQMPGLSGHETVELIRAGKAGKEKSDVYVVAVTASDTSNTRNACERVGMNDFVAKPVRAAGYQELVQGIRNHVNSTIAANQVSTEVS
jgi:CheY-like chemotaxis protein/signal transduction histidine kinase